MADVFKVFKGSNDITSTRTLLHEAIPLTGALVSGAYLESQADVNIKNYTHGMYQSVYDYPYLSSSANLIYDITCGFSSGSSLSGSGSSQNSKKINIYNQMAQVLAGYDQNGNIREFDQDGDLTGGTKLKECYFINFSRLIVKDEIKKGSFNLELGTVPTFAQDGDSTFGSRILITDASGTTGYHTNSPVGDYGVLYATASAGTEVLSASLLNDGANQPPCGLIYYQAGIVVLSGSAFTSRAQATLVNAIDTTGVAEYDAFSITVPVAAGGEAGPVTHQLTFVADANAVDALSNANNWGVAIDVASSAALQAAAIVDAINGTANAAVGYGTAAVNSVLAAGTLGLTATLTPGETTKVTLTMDVEGTAGNVASVLAAVTGFEGALLLESTFTGGVFNTNSLLGLGPAVDMSSLSPTQTMSDMLTGSTITQCADALRNRIYNISFNNTTELNSTIYFCRVNHNDFNYSANPTYLSSSKIRVKENIKDLPVSYITGLGLYSADNELMAVAKLSEPIKNDPTQEFTFRVRLDY